jgi:hypothetical protein
MSAVAAGGYDTPPAFTAEPITLAFFDFMPVHLRPISVDNHLTRMGAEQIAAFRRVQQWLPAMLAAKALKRRALKAERLAALEAVGAGRTHWAEPDVCDQGKPLPTDDEQDSMDDSDDETPPVTIYAAAAAVRQPQARGKRSKRA